MPKSGVWDRIIEAAREASNRQFRQLGQGDRVVRSVEGRDDSEPRGTKPPEGRETNLPIAAEPRATPTYLGDGQTSRGLNRDPQNAVALKASVSRILHTLLTEDTGPDHDDAIVWRLLMTGLELVIHIGEGKPAV